jgi:hypothetical protein
MIRMERETFVAGSSWRPGEAGGRQFVAIHTRHPIADSLRSRDPSVNHLCQFYTDTSLNVAGWSPGAPVTVAKRSAALVLTIPLRSRCADAGR